MKGRTGKLVLPGLHSLNSGPTEYPLILHPFPFRSMIYSWRAGLFATGEVAAAAQGGHRMLAGKKITLAKLAVHKVQDRWEMDTFGVLLGLKQLCFFVSTGSSNVSFWIHLASLCGSQREEILNLNQEGVGDIWIICPCRNLPKIPAKLHNASADGFVAWGSLLWGM